MASAVSVNVPAALPQSPQSTTSPSATASTTTTTTTTTTSRPPRPTLTSRKSSGSLVVPRDSPYVEVKEEDEDYDEGDARRMSPRRSSDEIERMGDDAKLALQEQAKALQESLLEIVDRVESVKSEHEKLEGGNKFLQSYIGELMQTSKLTAAGASAAGPGLKPTTVKGGYLGRSSK